MPDCISKDSLLQKPQEGLTYPSSGQLTSPFTLKGSPLVNRPQPLTGLTEYRRKTDATTDTRNQQAYFALDQYYTINLASEHILGEDQNTTLRFDNRNYTLRFACLHKALWVPKVQGKRPSTPPQVSLVFVTSDNQFFHICIPIQYTNSSQDENIFLKYWLYSNPSGSIPSGFTLNEILNFRGSEQDVRFATLQYCLTYNANRVTNPYTVCIFQTPLKVNLGNCPAWLRNDPNLEQPDEIPTQTQTFKTYRRKTFDEIFNYVLRGQVNAYIYDRTDPYIVSSEPHFDDERTQNVVLPAYFKVKSQELSGKLFNQSFSQQREGVRGLKNVKCYPIDLATQIDDEGNIFIDQSTNKPIDLNTVNINKLEEYDPDLALEARSKQKQNESWVRFIIAFSIIFLILLALVIVLVVFVFRGTSAAPPLPSAPLAPSVGEAVANVAENVANNVKTVVTNSTA
jgi:hypothetical protein